MQKYKTLMSLGMFCLVFGITLPRALPLVHVHPDAIDGVQGFFIGCAIALNLLAARARCRPVC